MLSTKAEMSCCLLSVGETIQLLKIIGNLENVQLGKQSGKMGILIPTYERC